jgi:hypothetical protein
MFYNDCIKSFESSHSKEELEKVHIDVMNHLKEIAELVVINTSNLRAKSVLEALLTLYVYCRDIVVDLLLKDIFHAEDFEWTRWVAIKHGYRQ